jgi:2-haloacid dehalogenase
MRNLGTKPEWLTFDCYGTLIQWDEGLVAAAGRILGRSRGRASPVGALSGAREQDFPIEDLLDLYDRKEHELEGTVPHLDFRTVSARGLEFAMTALGLPYTPADAVELTGAISRMPPFPEVVPALAQLKRMGFKLCVISNTDDDIIAGNVSQLGGHIDRVVTAQQAQGYKPGARIFAHAHESLGVSRAEVIHICASPTLDLQAARDLGFRCIWIDRGTGRRPLPDYTPDAILDKLDRVPVLFKQLGW